MSDPYLNRESMRYATPVASREYILKILSKSKKPLGLMQIVKKTNTPLECIDILKKRISAMLRDGQIKIKSKCYVAVGKLVKFKGVVQRLKDSSVEIITEDETIIPVHNFDAVFLLQGDIVSYRTVKKGIKSYAVVSDVLKRKCDYLLGMLELHGHDLYFISFMRGMPKMRVTSNVNSWNSMQVFKAEMSIKARNWTVKNIEVIGSCLDPDMPEIIAKHTAMVDDKHFNIDTVSSLQVKREDWTHLPLVTIDGETALDFDDAVMAHRYQNGWELYVAIADVSSYVPVSSDLDLHAYNRTTSIYFPKHCVPMLPEILSNDLCSLRPNQDRCAIGVRIRLSANGEIIDGDVQRVMINSKARMTYTQVEKMLNNEIDIPEWFVSSLTAMKEATIALQNLSDKKRALRLAPRQDHVVFDKDGSWAAMSINNAFFSNILIEKFMVTTNHFIALYLKNNNLEAIYRHHPTVRPEGFQVLLRELRNAGIETSDDYDLFSINEQIRNHDKYSLLSPWIVRSMSQARYDMKLSEHCGLSLDAYVHFTSPIRRYPDLMIHRAVCATIDGIINPKLASVANDIAAKRCSRLERRADACVYDSLDLYQCQWAYKNMNKEFSAIVVSSLSFGMFVRTQESSVELLLTSSHLESLGYRFDHNQSRWLHPVNMLELGQVLKVRIFNVSFLLRRKDAVIVEI